MTNRKFPLTKAMEAKRAELIQDVESAEHRDTIRDIRSVREKLEDISLRDFAEAFYGEEFTETVYGKEGGNIRMGDIRMSMHGTKVAGELSFGIEQEQMIKIMQDSHPGLTREAAVAMLTESGDTNQKALTDLRRQSRAVDSDHAKAFKNLERTTGVRMTEMDED